MTIAHLSACRYIFQEPKLALERDKIRLNMGVLKMLGEFWPAGQREYQTMGIIAREILALREEEYQVPEETQMFSKSLDTLDFDFEFDINWACDLFVNENPPLTNELLSSQGTDLTIMGRTPQYSELPRSSTITAT